MDIVLKKIRDAAEAFVSNKGSDRLRQYGLGINNGWKPLFDSAELFSAFEMGALFALSHQWIDVEEQLPLAYTALVVAGYQTLEADRPERYMMLAIYDGENFVDCYNDRIYNPEKWFEIPMPKLPKRRIEPCR